MHMETAFPQLPLDVKIFPVNFCVWPEMLLVDLENCACQLMSPLIIHKVTVSNKYTTASKNAQKHQIIVH